MIAFFMKLFNKVKPKSEIEYRDEWFAGSHNIAELERRMKVWENSNLKGWQKTQVARHPDRPYTLDYIKYIFTSAIIIECNAT